MKKFKLNDLKVKSFVTNPKMVQAGRQQEKESGPIVCTNYTEVEVYCPRSIPGPCPYTE